MGAGGRGRAGEQRPSNVPPNAYKAQHLNVRGKLKHFSITRTLNLNSFVHTQHDAGDKVSKYSVNKTRALTFESSWK